MERLCADFDQFVIAVRARRVFLIEEEVFHVVALGAAIGAAQETGALAGAAILASGHVCGGGFVVVVRCAAVAI